MKKKIHIKAIEERAPRSQKPLFEFWVDGEYQGKCSECIINTKEK